MIREIYQNYYLPVKPGELTIWDLHFWYDPIMPSLLEQQKNLQKQRKKRS